MLKLIVDIDGTICKTSKTDYTKSTPKKRIINKLNKLYEEGIEIVYWTARGGISGVDWTKLTKRQFKKWGVKYTKLIFHKPNYDYFICDKAMKPEEFLKLKEVN